MNVIRTYYLFMVAWYNETCYIPSNSLRGKFFCERVLFLRDLMSLISFQAINYTFLVILYTLFSWLIKTKTKSVLTRYVCLVSCFLIHYKYPLFSLHSSIRIKLNNRKISNHKLKYNNGQRKDPKKINCRR